MKRPRTRLDPDLVAAYGATLYRVYATTPFTLRIGEHSPELAALHAHHGVEHSAFVSACNPLGQVLPPEDNARRHADLRVTLQALGMAHIEGEGADPLGRWAAESSWLVLGLGRPGAESLGRSLQQNAIVWSRGDATPELVLLR